MNVIDISAEEFNSIYDFVGEKITSINFNATSAEIYGEKLQATISNYKLKWDSNIEPDEIFSTCIYTSSLSLNQSPVNELCFIEINCVATAVSKVTCVATDLLYSTGENFTFNFTSGFVIWFGEFGFLISTRPYQYGFIESTQPKLMSAVEIRALLSETEWYKFEFS